MNSKFGIAVLATAVVLFVVGYLLYGMLLASFFEANAGTATGVIKDAPDLLWIGLGQIPLAVLIALAIGWREATDVASGAKTGATVGFLVSLGMGLTQLGAFNINNLTSALVDPFVQAVLVGIAGAVCGMMMGRGGDTGAA